MHGDPITVATAAWRGSNGEPVVSRIDYRTGALVLSLWGWLCGCPTADEACADCESTSATHSAPVADWTARVPTFAAALQVLDEQGEPVHGAEVAVGARIILTGEDGWVRYADLRALSPQPMSASHAGFAPTLWTPSVIAAGSQSRQVVLQHLPAAQSFDPHAAFTVHGSEAQLRFPAMAFLAPDGGRLTSAVSARLLSRRADLLPLHALPGSRQASGSAGEPTVLEDPLHLVYVELEDDQGRAARFSPGSTATLTLELGARDGVEVGDPLGLYSLEWESGRWVHESSCTVRNRGERPSCSAQIAHLGYWLLAREPASAAELGCVHVVLDKEVDSQALGVETWAHLPLRRCDGQGACAEDGQLLRGLSVQQAASGPWLPAMCSLTKVGARYRAQVGGHTGSEGRVVISAEFVAAGESAPAALEWLQRGLPHDWSCAERCQTVVLKASADDVWTTLKDTDGDGYFGSLADKGAPLGLGGLLDCDDTRAERHPGAIEGACAPKDMDCDGNAAGEAPRYPPGEVEDCAMTVQELHRGQPPCAGLFNGLCAADCFERAADKPGNRFDEDCDGHAVDRDGDGFSATTTSSLPADCDDFSSLANPSQLEVPGNELDEDCDGLALDSDGDGYFGYGQEMAAMTLGLAAEDEVERFGDCDDHQPDIYPGAPIEAEIGQLARMYVDDGERGALRLASFCEYFDSDGLPTPAFTQHLRDFNCDGRLTDLDGDGWTRFDDDSLGAERAVDCNDFDPRVGERLAEPGGRCDDYAGTLNNGSACYPELPQDATPACPLLAAANAPMQCVDVGEGKGLCLYSGWSGGDPPRLVPGTLWGPCDGPGRLLPDCPEQAFCGAPVAFSSAVRGYLEQFFTGGEPLEMLGMCFQSCTPLP